MENYDVNVMTREPGVQAAQRTRIRSRFHFFSICLALTISIGVLVCTGLIPEWGRWYSDNNAYRRQTEALLRGDFALSHDPTTLAWDMAWVNEGVQQVWGLGVPIWRLPFEMVARLFGQDAFPDRLELGCALALVAYFMFRTLVVPLTPKKVFPSSLLQVHRVLVGLVVLLLFPPFLTMCRTWFNVYEEAQAYAYLIGISLFLATFSFFTRPTFNRYIGVGVLAGLAPFFRPTAGVYSVASLLLTWCYTKRLGWSHLKSSGAGIVFVAAGGLLYFTNWERFGAGFEFGHFLNVNGYDGMRFITHLANPLRGASLFGLANELFHYMFLTRSIPPTDDGFSSHLFTGQLSIPRWRDLYFSCYDLSFLILVANAWLWSLWTFWRRRNDMGRAIPPFSSCLFGLMGLWSLVSAFPLALFYLHYQVLTPRYMLDFGPAFAVAIWVVCCQFLGFLPSGKKAPIVIPAILACWWGYQVFSARILNVVAKPRTVSYSDLSVSSTSRDRAPVVLPNSYSIGMSLDEYRIPFNGDGWNVETGETKSSIVLFVMNPEIVTLTLAPKEGVELSEDDWKEIRVKIGRETLTAESYRITQLGKIITYGGPQTPSHRSGLQVLFIGLASPQNAGEPSSKFRLLDVQWRIGQN